MKKLLFFAVLSLLSFSVVAKTLPSKVYGGKWKAGHVQGIAVDNEQKYMYFSFTTMLVKTDMEGNVVGTVTGLLGHLGCLEFNEDDGRLYGSLEYKDDSIGKGILKREKSDAKLENGFYVAIFDVNKIVRMNMSAEKDGIMTTVYLPTILEDYNAAVEVGKKTLEHRFGCSGFDGISFGPRFGSKDPKKYLTLCYGIYGDVNREDNNYQVLLQYDTADWYKYEAPLSQDNMHRNGPAKFDTQYFVYTGNTNWGIQNLEYDRFSGNWFMFAYKGKKPNYANYQLFVVDGHKAPKMAKLAGVPYHKKGLTLSLLQQGSYDAPNKVYGWNFKWGATGVCSMHDGTFYISHNKKYKETGEQECTAYLYQFTGDTTTPFVKVK